VIRLVIDVGLGQDNVRFLIIAAAVLLGIGLLRSILTYALRYLASGSPPIPVTSCATASTTISSTYLLSSMTMPRRAIDQR